MQDKLQGNLANMTESLSQIDRKVRPIANMAETVRVCKDNINTALESINRVADGITEAEDVAEILIERRAMINSEFEVYVKSMLRGRELIRYFEGELAYFKDSYAIAEKLVIFNLFYNSLIESCTEKCGGGMRTVFGGKYKEAARYVQQKIHEKIPPAVKGTRDVLSL